MGDIPSYTIPNVRVVDCREYFTERHQSGQGKDAIFTKVSLGWFVQLEGSCEALYLGRERPEIVSGDRVTVKLIKEANDPVRTI
jgi:hypothetical protein